jgi:hypothetical protein
MTHEQYKDTYANGQQRTAAFRIGAVCGVGYRKDAVLTPEQLDALNARFGGGSKQRNARPPQRNTARAKSVPQLPALVTEPQLMPVPMPQTPTPEPQTAKAEPRKNIEAQILFFAPLIANVVSIALTIAGLWLFAGGYGVALGAMFGLMLLAAVIVSRNAKVGDTSTAALKTVLWMECGACVLHGFTFHTVLPDTNTYLRIGAAVLMAAFVAVLSYNAVLLVRNYNAETNDNENLPTA